MSEREILFRGKRCDNGEWIEGLPIRTYDTEIGKSSVDYENPAPVELMAGGRIVLECGYDEIPFFNIDEYPIVKPETVGQYTGLKDKNGTRIFEGDIVRIFDGEYCSAVIKYSNEKGSFTVDDTSLYYWVSDIEVIGNIFDNFELLKGD